MSSCFTSSSSSFGRRKFHDIPLQDSSGAEPTKDGDVNSLMSFITDDIIGNDSTLNGPYGKRKVVYCDYIASGRALHSIENYIRDEILPLYGNTHTTITVTSLQSSMFLQESRMIIRNAVKADEHDAVIFVGNGVTGAVDKLINGLSFNQPPVVFVGPHEHHSNLLPWREIAAKVIRISEDKTGRINLIHLESALKSWKRTKLTMVGCFSAASNVTGIINDTVAVSSMLHKYGALAFWDYATAGPYLDINMHPMCEGDASKDAIFLSMHKFIGGVDAPGVLVAKRGLFQNSVPSNSGGGSVFFVSREGHRYLQDVETREEGGTPRVVGSVRAALATELKNSIDTEAIMDKERRLYERAREKWKDHKNLHLLGYQDKNNQEQLAVFSFLVYCPETRNHLHHNYVAALLNDLFGIQARGGCACAGPYAQDLMGLSESKAFEFEQALLEDSQLDRVHLRRQGEYSKHEVLRPGFVRLNLSYFCSDEEADFVIDAVAMVAEHGWKLLPQYMFNPETGEWRHTKHRVFADRKWLGHALFTAGGLKVKKVTKTDLKPVPSCHDVLFLANEQFEQPLKGFEAKLADHQLMFDDQTKHLRWFLLPSEAQALLQKHSLSLLPPPDVLSVREHFQVLSLTEIEENVKVPEEFLSEDRIERLKVAKPSSGNILNGNRNESQPKDSFAPKKDSKQQNSALDENSDASVCSVRPRSKQKGANDTEIVNSKFVCPPKQMFKQIAEAIEEFQMINDGDKVLVCLSGGKDSLSLLHGLQQYKHYARSKGINFDLGAVTIDPMTSSYDPSPLIPYLRSLGVPYFYEEQNILEQALQTEASSICAFCSRMKRGRIYACARREGWNVLAFGQHLDDLAESFLMSAFHNGLLRTMKANYTVQEGDLRVIRPFIYVREIETRRFAKSAKLPVVPENCPACFEAPKERHRMKQLLAAQEILHPRLYNSLKEAMHPLYAKHKTGLESKR